LTVNEYTSLTYIN